MAVWPGGPSLPSPPLLSLCRTSLSVSVSSQESGANEKRGWCLCSCLRWMAVCCGSPRRGAAVALLMSGGVGKKDGRIQVHLKWNAGFSFHSHKRGLCVLEAPLARKRTRNEFALFFPSKRMKNKEKLKNVHLLLIECRYHLISTCRATTVCLPGDGATVGASGLGAQFSDCATSTATTLPRLCFPDST